MLKVIVAVASMRPAVGVCAPVRRTIASSAKLSCIAPDGRCSILLLMSLGMSTVPVDRSFSWMPRCWAPEEEFLIRLGLVVSAMAVRLAVIEAGGVGPLHVKLKLTSLWGPSVVETCRGPKSLKLMFSSLALTAQRGSTLMTVLP